MENTSSTNIRIGTRGSKLARWQADYLQQQLEERGFSSTLHIIKTKGDQIQHLGFDKLEGKGFFTREIEDALLNGDIDLAVHSMKDLPTQQPEGLAITAVSYRANPADCLLIREELVDEKQVLSLSANATVGTSSARRKALMLNLKPDVKLLDIRGNVPTRIQKLKDGQFDAILLAAAGLERISPDLSGLKVIELSPREFVPAPAQGVLAYQVCKADKALRRQLTSIHHQEVSTTTNIERKVLQLMGGGCHMPLGVYCQRDQMGHYHVWAAMAKNWDSPLVRTRLSSSTRINMAEQIVEQLQKQL